MTSNQKNWTVLLSTMLAIGAVVLTIFEKNGVDEEIVTLTLRLTAWTSLLIYLLIFVARPLNQLVDSQKIRSMKKSTLLQYRICRQPYSALGAYHQFCVWPGHSVANTRRWRYRVSISVSNADYIFRHAGRSDRTGCMAPSAQGWALLDRRDFRLYPRQKFHIQPSQPDPSGIGRSNSRRDQCAGNRVSQAGKNLGVCRA